MTESYSHTMCCGNHPEDCRCPTMGWEDHNTKAADPVAKAIIEQAVAKGPGPYRMTGNPDLDGTFTS